MRVPDFLPDREPDRVVVAEKLFEKRPVSDIGLFKPNDGIIYFYDQPIVFVAWIDNVQYLFSMLDDEYVGPPDTAKGWHIYFAIAVPADFLVEVYKSQHPFRAAYDVVAPTLYIHAPWERLSNDTWKTEYRIWNDVPVQEDWKPDKGFFLDPKKTKEI